MGNMDGWNLALLAVAVYVAVVSLMRLMAHRRDEKTAEFRREVEKEARRKGAERPSNQRAA